LALLLAAPLAHAVVTPKKVLGGSADQWAPAASDAWLTYNAYDGNLLTAFAMRRSTGFTFKMNEAGTSGTAGGMDPDQDVAVYQQWKGSSSSIYLYDLQDRSRRKAPGVVNTAAWEWDPRISNRYISFFRNREANGVEYIDLFIYRRDTGALRKVASIKRAAFTVQDFLFLANGSVGDRYVTWTGCPKKSGDCDVWVYDAVEKTTKTVTGGGDKQEYAGVVDEENGFVYFARSGNGCAVNLGIMRIGLDHLAGTPTKVADLADGYDVGYEASIAVNDETGEVDYYFERGLCSNWNADIYVAEGVNVA
jgi:hypothetical protein